MKAICLIDYNMAVRGGVEQVTASLANALADFYDVHVLSLCLTGECAYTLDPRVHFRSFLPKEARLREMRQTLKPLLAQYIARHGISVCVLQGNYTGLIASSLRHTSRAKLIFCDHGALLNQWGQKDIVAIRLISSLLCHHVVALTEQSRAAYMKKFHLPRRRVSCIYNWMDLSVPRSPSYDTSSKRIVSAGRFGKEKGFDQLIHAFAPVARKHPDWQLDIFGDGEMMDTVRKLVGDYQLSGQVHLPGMVQDLPQRYGQYAMYVLPSYREGLPLVLLEAKANRLPIVSFDISTGPREIVRDNVDGLLVPPCDTAAMAQAMCRLIEDPALRQQMSDRSQDDLARFSKQTILKQWCDLFEAL